MDQAPTMNGQKMEPTGVMTIPGWIPVSKKDGSQLLDGKWYAPMAGENSLNLAIGSSMKNYSMYLLGKLIIEMEKDDADRRMVEIVKNQLDEIEKGNL